jgi:hypothetical protein
MEYLGELLCADWRLSRNIEAAAYVAHDGLKVGLADVNRTHGLEAQPFDPRDNRHRPGTD